MIKQNKKEIINIPVFIANKADIVNKFNDDTLSDELSTYIYEECKGYPVNSKIEIDIETNFPLTNEVKNTIVDLIHANYGILVKENLIYQKRKRMSELSMFILGLILVFSAQLVGNNGFILLDEIILIMGWVFIWEFSYSIFFYDIKRKVEINRYRQLSKCKIKFLDNKQGNS